MPRDLLPGGEVLFQGITVNEFNSGVDFALAKAQGIDAVVVRATAGDDYQDAALDASVQKARDAAMRYGFYHYLTAADEAQARAQAQTFASAIAGYDYNLRPAMRFESIGDLDFASVNRIALAFLSAVEAATGVAPVVYTDARSASLLWNRSVADGYGLWVVDEDDIENPRAGNSPWSDWVGWQFRSYTEDGAQVPVSRFTAGMLRSQIVVPEPPPQSATKLICINVAYGDTLSGIARLFNTTVDSIVQLNDIANPNLILPGQRLFLRVANSVPYGCCDTYIVRSGDTLSGIARRLGVSWRRVAAINELANPNLIFPGQEIKLGVCPAD